MTNPASNNQVKEWRKLLMGKYRKKNGFFLAEGLRCVEQILRNPFVDVVEVLHDGSSTIDELHIPPGLPVFELSRDDFSSISDTETPQGVIAVCRIPEEVAPGDLLQNEGIIVALDAVQDPGNLGTIIRTVAWFGVKAVVFGTGCVDPFHPKVVRSTAGATGAVPYTRGDLGTLLPVFEKNGWQVCLLDGSPQSTNIRTVTPGKKTILVAGNEANGINPNLFGSNRIPVRIEGDSATVESLNVAMALGIGLFGLGGG